MKQERPGRTSVLKSGSLNLLKRIGHAIIGEISDKSSLMDILRDVQSRNIISSETLSMIEGVMEVTDTQVREVMIPRSQMIVIESDAGADVILGCIIESSHSRFPVIGDNRDDIEGIILAKDMLNFFANEDHKKLDLKEYMRPAVFIPESKRLNVLLRDFRTNRNHMAMVVDEYGGVSGLVTIEDVLEEIVGEIEDEHDVEEDSNITSHGEGVYSVQALTEIDEFNRFFRSSFSNDKFDTIGGIIMNAFGYMPQRGEEIELGNFLFKVTRADHRRIHSVRVIRVSVTGSA
ncbi:MAG: CBS domain-containing protein [gamma proteobacterium symbiont of Bathyaustriella thionipta]|nr:CBS domain-containing protein [gamma proteobacterium symbiont of Bathyaustriella thionipta]MCU7949159.1 CBS domain-containing protein [gamma proteobacterium symbiont of Bathyaustriella thionipta]MCU7953361.1 CBS domain-containing protein [gamma proteobacterium symbiont of Bathyaustriella thionipta]MCU7955745.1 CBS domain-containing protein [gamma proteobacterium symbiont of Bathyaustriella thionipta]MCU7965914.1 CBS domain-containing protein [gamma proteobacterium symbiont of Bathyaustriella